jgi:hypothetical protein
MAVFVVQHVLWVNLEQELVALARIVLLDSTVRGHWHWIRHTFWNVHHVKKESIKVNMDNRCVCPAPRVPLWTPLAKINNAKSVKSISLVKMPVLKIAPLVVLVRVRQNKPVVLVVHFAVLEHMARGVKIVFKGNTAMEVIL